MVKVQVIRDTDETERDDIGKAIKNDDVPSSQTIILGEDDQMEIIGFKINLFKNYLTWLFYILSGGLLRLFFHWFPHLKLYSTHSKCNLDKADKVLIVDIYKSRFKSYFVKDIDTKSTGFESKEESPNLKRNLTLHLEDGKILELQTARVIKFKKIHFVWDPERKMFTRLIGLDFGKCNKDFHRYFGITEEEQELKRIIYGRNEINIPVQTILTLLVLEALTPFYIFQVFSIIVWLAEAYYYYGIAIVLMSAYGITSSIIQTRANQKNLKGTVFTEATVEVCRGNNVFEELKTSDLVPGDLIAIPAGGCNMQCDAILLKGSCIVNESMLTGESVPVHKTPLPNDDNLYRAKEDSNHTLFCGTSVLQTKQCGERETLAVVIRTGYLTTKGELVRSILYPPPADFKFDQDSYKFIGILTFIAMLGLVYTVVIKSSRNLPFWDIAIKALDLVTIAIPPALPAAMTIGKLYALERLKKRNIYCINSRVINVSGSIDCVCFDKTGTLTEDELDMWGVLPANDGKIGAPVKQITHLKDDSLLFRGMLTCHSLSLIDGKLCGYPLDLKMFHSTAWYYRAPNDKMIGNKKLKPEALVQLHQDSEGDKNEIIEIYAQYPFISALQRSSVICRNTKQESHFEVFCKGSPEMITSLSKAESIPDDIFEKLDFFTAKGYRVVAMGRRDLKVDDDEISKLTRADIEKDLQFLGLIILENRLKKETPGAIEILKTAGLKTLMITGDNIQTAVSVAKECGILEQNSFIIEVKATNSPKIGPKLSYHLFDNDIYDSKISITEHFLPENYDPESMYNRYQFVLTGTSWMNVVDYFPKIIPDIIDKGVVFARMSARQKQQLIEKLKHTGYYVAMCGDGANDCAALKAAHLGISLSEAEASIAAPFTSKEFNISCVPKIIREGRAALLTSFGVFKFMVCGSLVEFFCTTILYGIDCNLSSMQFLYLDIFLQLNLASFFGNTEACDKLNNKPPLTSLLSFVPLMSMILYMLQAIGFQTMAFYYVRFFDWFKPFEYVPFETEVSKCDENYSIFVIAMFQYITMAIIYSKGEPFRKAIYTNKIFTTSIVVITLLSCYITFYPARWLVHLLEMNLPPDFEVRWQLLCIALINFILAFFVEEFLVDVMLDKIMYPMYKEYRRSKKNCEDVDFAGNLSMGGKDVLSIHAENEINESKRLSRGINERNIITKC